MKCLSYSSMVACVLVLGLSQVSGAPTMPNIGSDTGVFVRDIMGSLGVYLTGIFSDVGNLANSYISPNRRRPYYNSPPPFNPHQNIDLRTNELSPNRRPGDINDGSSHVRVDAPFANVNVDDNGGSRVRVRAPFTNVDVNEGSDYVNVRAPFTDVHVKKGSGVNVRAPFTDVNQGSDHVNVRAPFTDVHQGSDRVNVRAPFADVNVRKGSGVNVRAPFTSVDTSSDGSGDFHVRVPFADVRKVDGVTKVIAPFTDLFLQYGK